MRDIVIIPTYYRPEYLTVCLEHIQAARGTRELDVRVYHDGRAGKPPIYDSLMIAERAGAQFIYRKPHHGIGNIHNFLEAYKDAHSTDARYVYLIEDDVLVGRDFFDWHEAIQSRGDYFCSIGWHCIRNTQVRPSNDPRAYVESNRDFSSIGVCWKRENLAHVVKHATLEYYQYPSAYLQSAFPDSPIPSKQWVEQAGLIMRLLLAGQGKRVVAWAAMPRCAHVGVHGYHRMRGPQFRNADELREAVRTGNIHGIGPQFFDDINTLPPLQEWHPEALYVCQRF